MLFLTFVLKRAASDGARARSDRCAVLVRGAAELRRSVAAAAFCERGRLACLKRGGGNEGGHGQGEESLDLHFEMCNGAVFGNEEEFDCDARVDGIEEQLYIGTRIVPRITRHHQQLPLSQESRPYDTGKSF